MKKRGRGTYLGDMPAITTMVCRTNQKVIFYVPERLSAQLIRHNIRKHCKGEVIIYSDEYSIYRRIKKLNKVKAHKTVTHSQHIYADGETHSNNCENRHSLLRPFLNIFRGVSKKNLNSYVKFFQFTFNNGLKWPEKALKTLFTKYTIKRT